MSLMNGSLPHDSGHCEMLFVVEAEDFVVSASSNLVDAEM